LAVPTGLAGFWGINSFLGQHFQPGQATHPGNWWHELFAPFEHAPLAAIAGLGAVAFGLSFAYALYAHATKDPLPEKVSGLSRAMRNGFYFDQFYEKLIALTHEALARLADVLDRYVIAGWGVRGLSGMTDLCGRALRMVQTGNLQVYAFLFVVGVVVVIFLALK